MVPNWVIGAKKLQLAFAQVREDPFLDASIATRLPAGARVLMIASGGCTAAYLAAVPQIGSLHVVDANPAQLALRSRNEIK